MKILMNEKNQAQCPICGKWVDIIVNTQVNNQHEIHCQNCRRKWALFIKKEKEERGKKKKKKKQVKRKQ